MSQGKQPSVLLIEADSSLRRVITLGLQCRGMHVIEVSPSEANSAFDAQRFDLLLLDIDNNTQRDLPLLESVRCHPSVSRVPVIILAWENPTHTYDLPSEQCQLTTSTLTQLMYVAKPFDARTLHDTVDQLLKVHKVYALGETTGTARKEEALLAAYSARPSLSIWPVITAAGLLLTFMGMMLQIAVVLLGVLIVLIASMLWVLEKKPEQKTAVLA